MALEGDGSRREVCVDLDDMKFHAAHFVAYRGYREPLHGHNYSFGVRTGGVLGADGYVLDFADLKRAARDACRSLSHCVLLPANSDVLTCRPAASEPDHIEVLCEEGPRFLFPAQDCRIIPVAHTTAEELSEFLWLDVLQRNGLASLLRSRGITWMEVCIRERVGQGAKFTQSLHAFFDRSAEAARYVPKPCPSAGPPHDMLSHVGFGASSLEPGFGFDDTAAVACSELISAEPDTARGADDHQTRLLRAEAAFRMLLATLPRGEGSREELRKTPMRAAKAFLEMTSGMLFEDPAAVASQGVFEAPETDGVVCLRDIRFTSICVHHLLPFSGVANVAYVPDSRVLGLSKFARLLRALSQRLQLQERLTVQFADALFALLQPRALAVAFEASHNCMCARGITSDAVTRTQLVRGPEACDPTWRQELLRCVSFSRGHSRL